MIYIKDGKLLNNYLGKSKNKNWANIFSKILICLIFFFASLIFTSLNDDFLALYQKYVFEDTFKFNEFNDFYTKFAGGISFGSSDAPVFGEVLEYQNIEKYLDGEKLTVATDTIVNAMTGGIVVFIGQKEGYNNTVIIQCNNGYDIWYGNLESVDVNIYDYVSENALIGSASDYMYLLITKDSKYYTYEEYQNQI